MTPPRPILLRLAGIRERSLPSPAQCLVLASRRVVRLTGLRSVEQPSLPPRTPVAHTSNGEAPHRLPGREQDAVAIDGWLAAYESQTRHSRQVRQRRCGVHRGRRNVRAVGPPLVARAPRPAALSPDRPWWPRPGPGPYRGLKARPPKPRKHPIASVLKYFSVRTCSFRPSL